MEEHMLRRALGCIVVVGMILTLPSALRADSEVANPENLFPIVRNASGVSVSGELAIYYDVNADNPMGCGLDQVNMFFVLRLQKGPQGAPAGFAGSLRDVCYETSEAQIAAVMQFVQDAVVPYFFPQSKSPTLQLTDVSRIVQDGQTQFAPPYFFLMNVEFKVKP
jgi:hypothetical protein